VLNSDHLMQALEAAGADGNVIYVSVAITSGLREIALLNELGLRSAYTLRMQHRDRWLAEVVGPNESDAHCYAAAVRSAVWANGALVVDPSRMSVEGWNQDDYNGFWVELMSRHARQVVASPGWEFSQGARMEIGYGLGLGLEVVDIEGKPLPAGQLRTAAEDARTQLTTAGWTLAEVDAYLLPLGDGARPTLHPSPQSAVFSWLGSERQRQVDLHPPDVDDRRTREGGIATDGGWARQLRKYWERAQDQGLEDPKGRLALARCVATACGLLESVVRVHGPISVSGTTEEGSDG
jgi:hypothetical protein